MILAKLLNKNKVCKHTRVSVDIDFAYCPDCGELIENQWYLTRCSCCGIKLQAIIKNNEIFPVQKFCHNCGTKNYITEKLDKINFIDINFAVMVKTIITNKIRNYTQSWVEPNMHTSLKMIASTKFQT